MEGNFLADKAHLRQGVEDGVGGDPHQGMEDTAELWRAAQGKSS